MKKHIATTLNDFLNEGKNYFGMSVDYIKQQKKFFKKEGFIVSIHKDKGVICAELDKLTEGGINMHITLKPFSYVTFVDYVENFDIDEEIKILRQDEEYIKGFTIDSSKEDITNFYNSLNDIAEKILKYFR